MVAFNNIQPGDVLWSREAHGAYRVTVVSVNEAERSAVLKWDFGERKADESDLRRLARSAPGKRKPK